MKFLLKGLAPFLLMSILVVASCDKNEPEEPQIPNEEELITSLYYYLVDPIEEDTVLFSFVDLDGDGGDDPVITNDTLKPNTEYNAYVMVWNELEDPPENITEEVEEEAEEHQFFYLVSNGDILQIAYDDIDPDGYPIGIQTVVNTGDAGSSALQIILRHEPAKDATGVSDGNIENAGGETDIQVDFTVEIQ